MWLADTNFPSEKNFEVENFQLLTMIFSENFLSMEIFLEWKWAFTKSRVVLTIYYFTSFSKAESSFLPWRDLRPGVLGEETFIVM